MPSPKHHYLALNQRIALGWCVLWLGLSTQIGLAQIYPHTIYTEEDGLISSRVYDIEQASDGVIWMATAKGVSAYDGATWTNYPNAKSSLPRDPEMKMVALQDTSIWVAGFSQTQLCIHQWKDNQWHQIPNPIAQMGYQPTLYGFAAALEDSITHLSIGDSIIHVYRSDTKKWQHYTLPKPVTACYTLHFDHQYRLWAGTNQGLFIIEENQLKPVKLNLEYIEDQKLKIFKFKNIDDKIIFITQAQIFEIKNKKIKLICNTNPSTDFNSVRHINISFSPYSGILFSNTSKLKVVKNKFFDQIKFDNQLNSYWPNDIQNDQENNIWIATDRGVVKLTSLHFISFDQTNGLPENEVSAICIGTHLEILLGSNTSLSIIKNNQIKILEDLRNDKDSKSNYRIMRIIKDQDTYYFSANRKGLGVFKDKKLRWYQHSDDPNSSLVDVFSYKNQIYTIYNSTIQKFNDGKFEYVTESGFYIRKTRLINGKIWVIGHDIVAFDGENIEPIAHSPTGHWGVCYDAIQWREKIYVASHDGLLEFTDEGWKQANLNDQQIDQSCFSLMVDSKDHLWIGTSYGVYLHDGQSLYHFHRKSGLIGNESNRNALVEDYEGRIWIGTELGVSVFDYDKWNKEVHTPRLKLKKLITNKGQVLSPGKDLELPDEENSIEFSFVGISFQDERSINYRYRLKGHDTSWYELRSNKYPIAKFTNLSAGKYQFEVQSRIKTQPWSAPQRSGLITIRPKFTDTFTFYILAISGLMVIGFVIAQLFAKVKDNRILVAKVQQKTALIEQSKKNLDQKNKELQEINHELDRFVYGISHDLKSSLNSITGLIKMLQASNTETERLQVISLISTSIDRLKSLIDDLQVYSRNKKTGLNFQVIDLKKLIKDVIDTQKYSHEALNVDIQYKIHQQDKNFVSDYSRIFIILSNLLSNGIKYRNKYFGNSYINIEVESQGSNMLFKVEDNGIGISDEMITNLFGMYKKGSSDKNSSGLGLFIVKETVDRLDGSIDVTSKVNKGTTFFLKIPNQSKSSL